MATNSISKEIKIIDIHKFIDTLEKAEEEFSQSETKHIRKAIQEAREGKTVPLRSLIR